MVQLAPRRLKAFCDAVLAEATNGLAADEVFTRPTRSRVSHPTPEPQSGRALLRHRFASRCGEKLCSAKAKHMEMERLNVPDDAVHNWFTILRDSISDTPAHFIVTWTKWAARSTLMPNRSNASSPRTSLICRTMRSPGAARGSH
jgi:hypothetical protein